MMGDWEQKGLINELTQGRELAKQLQLHLTISSSSSSLESREVLVQKILASYEKALSIATCTSNSTAFTAAAARAVDSPPSLTGSPRSEDSDREGKETTTEQRDLYKRRKTMPRWTQHVRVTHGAALEGPLDDGFSWRKYGQKDILGAHYPRGYYRCTHRNVQGCLATKQVQRKDEDPSIYEITYRGRHTCSQVQQHPQSTAAVPPLENKEQSTLLHHPEHQSPELLQSFHRNLKVVTEDMEAHNHHHHHQPYSSYGFASPSSSTAQDNLFSIITNQVASPFISPAASGTSGFNLAASSTGAHQDVHDQMNHDITSLSATSSAADSATVGYGFPFGSVEFDPNFTFDHPGFFS